jgi:hypothetical protein
MPILTGIIKLSHRDVCLLMVRGEVAPSNVYFISRLGKSAYIPYDHARGDFKLSCRRPCPAVSYFHRTMLKPYSVCAEGLLRGDSDFAECRPIIPEKPAELAASSGSACTLSLKTRFSARNVSAGASGRGNQWYEKQAVPLANCVP